MMNISSDEDEDRTPVSMPQSTYKSLRPATVYMFTSPSGKRYIGETKRKLGQRLNAKRSATWESTREQRLCGLEGKARVQKLARLKRDRERKTRKRAEARTSC